MVSQNVESSQKVTEGDREKTARVLWVFEQEADATRVMNQLRLDVPSV